MHLEQFCLKFSGAEKPSLEPFLHTMAFEFFPKFCQQTVRDYMCRAQNCR